MLLGTISALLMAGGGYLALHLLGLSRKRVGGGLTPAAGVAVLAIFSTWGLQLGVPELALGMVLLASCMMGLALAGWHSLLLAREHRCFDRVTLALLSAASGVPLLVLGQALWVQAGIPDYIHDGAHHAETVEALRHGGRIAAFDWYPTGFHAPAAALLTLLPAVDSARGVVDWAIGLTILAPLAIFGFGAALWRDARVAATGALLLALTSTFPYDVHLYSVWPMAAALLMVVGLWTTTLEYLSEPRLHLALVAGLLAAGLILTHGTEIYTAAIGMVILAAADWRRIPWRQVVAHAALALLLALALAAPYLPLLGGWAAAGGAVAVGTDYFDARHGAQVNDALQEVLFWAGAVSSGLLVDLPFRLASLGVGGWIVFRHRSGREVLWLCGVFACLVAGFRYVDAEPLRSIFALTLPWGVDDRLLMTLPLLAAPLGGLGLVRASAGIARQSRRAARRLLVFSLAFAVASVFLVAVKFKLQTDGIVTFSADDAAALAWLSQQALPGEVLMNDGAADAGIWAPFKASVPIVLPRTRSVSPAGPEVLLRANLGHLERADVQEAACSLGVRYVFRGEASSPSEAREFPGLHDLRDNPALEEVFSRGQASVFRMRLPCSG